ncbi:MAG TPA: MerR family transcriptional regulator [Stackebrandtia sp.]|uniref:MerR family transcriptional regulator n=1 Tax=Stackebrandtia sp. TaxID=2023065 RepID=UPI002D323E05|nr:MerR family transcriptional regulator [Stackebrandtia sp.]HZE40849.1 MerR family transcriptional regulator [Stackebrandtia sp.]
MLEVKQEADEVTSEDTIGFTIAEAAERSGVSVHTLRYYERAGLVVGSVGRTSGGWRRYSTADLRWIGVCTKFRAAGMPIRTIRRYTELVTAGPGNEAERLALLENHRDDVVAKLAELTDSLAIIDHKLEVYRGRMAEGNAAQLWTNAPNNKR